ncbi:hypothetical protein REB14_14540 [Chryseobacterium sp. ES2]|uniref:LPS export ABC transporter periplasmic protein LptC n=1 Tax=Chryseobacterium metallicongregator TaxID=3073042 RepID=A0ABU1E6I2_9FLAO|nr:hypothetical protein [Chryseobacterium sp. ES2]MDR4953396.1 hypothetical protein [Chryseobacterium sp. ES2]
MIKYIFSIFCTMVFLSSYGQKLYKIEKDKYGEPLLNDKAQYSFKEEPSEEDLKAIDTTAYYVQVFEGRSYNKEEMKNPRIIIFHKNVFFKNESLMYFGKFDIHRGKNSVYYGGKYRIKNNTIQLEQFGNSPDSKNWYTRYITKGKINNNKIIFNEGLVAVFEKRKNLPIK